MFPTINKKDLLDCNEADLNAMVGNPDFRESELLDYKENLPFIAMDKSDPKRVDKLADFRSDVCSFANAQGGYILYGISEKQGIAKEICGIVIPNDDTDKFQLDRNNNLQAIMPKMPSVKFKFIKLQNGKYVVILFIQHDDFVPYLHIEHNNDYRIYKRVGNGNQNIPYPELKQMFMQSQSLSESILAYRQERISYFRSQEDTPDLQYSRFMLLHIIPDTFRDSSHNKNMYYLSLKNNFSGIFSALDCTNYIAPNVDGLRYKHFRNNSECTLYNNGTAECFLPLYTKVSGNENKVFLIIDEIIYIIKETVQQYIKALGNILDTQRLLVGMSFLGCKGIISGEDQLNEYTIDRQTIICNPILIQDISSEKNVQDSLKLATIEYYLSLGIRFYQPLIDLMNEVYHDKL